MKAGLVGPSSQQRSLPFDAQRTVNLIPYVDQQGKEVSSLIGTPGLNIFAVLGAGPGRGAFVSTNGRVFVVSGNFLFELFANGGGTQLGTLAFSSGIVTMDENNSQLVICDSANLYIFTYATNAFQMVVTANLPSAGTVTTIDGYFIVSRPNTGIFQSSALNDGFTWPALAFATAESSPDLLLRVLNVSGQLWLFGAKTIEIWTDNGRIPFPFERVNGGKLDSGTVSPYTPINLDNSAIWVGRDENGFGIVYRADGLSPQRISDEAIELRIQSAPTLDSLRTYSYQEDGHTYYVLTGGNMETSLVYDLATQLWHERAFLNPAGNYELHLASYVVYAFNRQIALDRRNGNIYEQKISFYSDNGEEIARDRTFTHLSEENVRFTINNLTVGFEPGMGIESGPSNDVLPTATLYVSRDGGKTFPVTQKSTMGRVGRYTRRIIFRRLGQYRTATFRFRVTDRIKVAITGAYFNTAD